MPKKKSKKRDRIADHLRIKINEVLKELRPNLLADGGNIEPLGVENGILRVRLVGTCASCPMSDITLNWGVESLVKERIPEIRGVKLVR